MLRHLITVDNCFQGIPKQIKLLIFSKLLELLVLCHKHFNIGELWAIFCKYLSVEQLSYLAIDFECWVLLSFFCLKHLNVSSVVQSQRVFANQGSFCNAFHVTTSSTWRLNSLRWVFRTESDDWKSRTSTLIINSNATFFCC